MRYVLTNSAYSSDSWVHTVFFTFECPTLLNYLCFRLADLLAKDANNHSPGVVINMSSVAGINPVADSGRLSANNAGVYSCECLSSHLPDHH